MAPRLTERQTRALAAVERRGSASLLDVARDLPDVRPMSALARVLKSLIARQLLRSEGAPMMLYVGGVRFMPIGQEDPLGHLERLRASLLHSTELTSWVDTGANSITILLPLTEIARNLSGRSYSAVAALAGDVTGSYDLIRARAEGLRNRGQSIHLDLSTETQIDNRGRCCAVIQVRSEVADQRNAP